MGEFKSIPAKLKNILTELETEVEAVEFYKRINNTLDEKKTL